MRSVGTPPPRETPRPQPGLLQAIVGHPGTAWAVLGVCLLVTVAVWVASRSSIEHQLSQDFEHELRRAEFIVSRRLLVFERMLLGVRGLLEVSGDVDRASWQRYVDSLQLTEYYPGVRGVGFIRWVPSHQKDEYEARMRRSGLPDFTVRPQSTAAGYAVVERLEPLDSSNARVLGFDVWSEAKRRAALEQARDTGQPAITQRVVLVAQFGDARPQPAVIISMPLYRRGMPTTTTDERRRALAGWVYSPLLMDTLVEDVKQGISRDIELQLFDSLNESPESLLFATGASVAGLAPSTDARTLSARLMPAGARWTLRATARPSFESAGGGRQPVALIIAGLLLDGTLFALFWSLARQRQRALHLAEEMTENSRRTVKALEREFAERGQAEAALREAEARLRLSVAASNIGMWDWDLVTGQVYCSPEWKAQIGYADDEIPNRFEEWERRLHPEDRAPTLSAAKRFIEDATARYAVEFRLQHKDGSYRWIFTQAQIYRSDAGHPLRMIGCHLDISERKKAEADLRSDAAFRRAVIEQVSEGLCVCHPAPDAPHLVFTVWNARMTEITGYSIEEINRTGWYNALFREPEARAEARQRLFPTDRGSASESREWEITRADGATRVLAVSARVVESADASVHVLALMRDVTEQRLAERLLRESERRFRELAENVQEVFWVRPGHASFSYVSPAFETVWGRPREFVLESFEAWTSTVHPDDLEGVLSQLLGDTACECEYRITRPDGSIRWVRDRAFPMHDASGALVRVVGVAEDITARKLAEQERESLDERLRQAQKMEAIGTLAGGIAHDFNNILGAIIANVDLARMDVPSEHPARTSLDQIYQSSQRAASLVQQILAFSRKRPEEKHLVDITVSVREAVKLLRAPIPATIELTTTFGDDVPRVLADSTAIDQVLMNLCTNAWHALEGRPGDIHVTVEGVVLDREAASQHPDLRPGQYARLTASDTGKGMTPHTRERIFDPFFTTKDVGQGTGLGLSVVHGIVTNLKGAITVSSQPGVGTSFAIYFPAAAAAPTVPEPLPSADARLHGRGQRVLFLDDEQPLVTAATRMLGRRGFTVVGFTTTAEAISALQATPDAFDVVVTDYNMPGASGLDMVRQIRASGSLIGIVMASGLMTEALRAEAAEAGVQRVLAKPYSGDDLVEAIQGLFDHQQAA